MTEGSVLVTKILPGCIALIMLGLGLTLKVDDFKRVLVFPKAVVVGLGTQMILLVGLAFGLAQVFKLPPELAVGLMILAASPGGVTANVFSHLARGDVALNLTLTAVNSVLAIFTMPWIVNSSLSFFSGSDAGIGLQFGKFLEVCLLILVPVMLGLLIRGRRPQIAARVERPVRVFSLVFLFALIVMAVAKDWTTLREYFPQLGAVVIFFNLLSLGLGFGVARVFRLSMKQSTAIALEIGIHNGALAIFIALNVLENYSMATPAAVYSIFMYLSGTAVSLWFQSKNG